MTREEELILEINRLRKLSQLRKEISEKAESDLHDLQFHVSCLKASILRYLEAHPEIKEDYLGRELLKRLEEC